MIKNNENTPVCRACGGACCSSFPGGYHPDQFGPNLEGVEELLRNREAEIDWWDGDRVTWEGFSATLEHPGVHLRAAAGRLSQRKVYRPLSRRTQCSNWLAGAGCSLRFDNRPYACQALVVAPDIGCPAKPEEGKPGLTLAWQPHARRLIEIGDRVAADFDEASHEYALANQTTEGLFGWLSDLASR